MRFQVIYIVFAYDGINFKNIPVEIAKGPIGDIGSVAIKEKSRGTNAGKREKSRKKHKKRYYINVHFFKFHQRLSSLS